LAYWQSKKLIFSIANKLWKLIFTAFCI
jgi:hypothetical protein